MRIDATIARVITGQHGLATTQQLVEEGLTKGQIRQRRRSGLLIGVHRGVWRVATHPTTREQRILAGVLAAGPGALAAQRSAAHLWGLELRDADEVDVVVPMPRAPRVPGVHVHRTHNRADLRPSVRDGIPCTSPLRLLVDLGIVAPGAVGAALEQLLVSRVVTMGAVRAALERHGHPGHAGTRALRAVLEDRALGDKPPDSVLEPAMAKLLRGYRLPPMTFHHPVTAGGRRFVLDFAYPDLRIAVEVDGNEKHGQLSAMLSDRRRDALLSTAGWVVQRFMWLQVVQEPAWVAACIGDLHHVRRVS